MIRVPRRVLRSGREGPIVPGPVDPTVEDPAGGRFPRHRLPFRSGEGFHPFNSTKECMGPVHLREDTISKVVMSLVRSLAVVYSEFSQIEISSRRSRSQQHRRTSSDEITHSQNKVFQFVLPFPIA